MYECFSLVLTVTDDCNLRCGYCYTGRKRPGAMDADLGNKAVDRAIRSVRRGGRFELGFFGGEPLLQPRLIDGFLERAERGCDERAIELRSHLTTNGTQVGPEAWRVMNRPGMEISVSHDGLPEVHDRHRRTVDGRPTSARVLETIDRMLNAGRDVSVVMVTRPDSVKDLADGILFLRSRGVRRFLPTLDLWTSWTADDLRSLEASLSRCAEVWASGLPDGGVGWFDEKAAQLAGVHDTTARCGFGDGEIAVSPEGNLYPCERLMGEDDPTNPFRLPGHATEGEEFAPLPVPETDASECAACATKTQCGATCRCSNYVRTGDVRRPDGLLCLLDRVCRRETRRVLHGMDAVDVSFSN